METGRIDWLSIGESLWALIVLTAVVYGLYRLAEIAAQLLMNVLGVFV